MNSQHSGRLPVIISMVIFGTIGLVRRLIPFPSSVVAMVRAVIGTLFLLAVFLLKREKTDSAAFRRNALRLFVSGALIGFNWIVLFEAYRFTTVSAATVCYYMAPVIVIVLSPFIFGEKLTLRRGICALAAVFGMLLVSGVMETGLAGAKGMLLGLLAACMYASVVMINKSIDGLSSELRTLAQLGAGAVVLVPYVILTERTPFADATGGVWLLVLVAGIVHTGIAYWLYFAGIRTLKAQTAALLSYIDPVVAVLISVFVLHEPLTIAAAIGCVLVIGAMVISEMEQDRSA